MRLNANFTGERRLAKRDALASQSKVGLEGAVSRSDSSDRLVAIPIVHIGLPIGID